MQTDGQTDRQHLKASNVYTYIMPQTQSQISDRSFVATGPWPWNNMPVNFNRKHKV